MGKGETFIGIVVAGVTAGAGTGALVGSGVGTCGLPVVGTVTGAVGGSVIGGLLGFGVDTTIILISNRTNIHGLDFIGHSHPGNATIDSKSTSTADFYNPEDI
ncbi:unnamed protein product [Adineta steineri]|uniref:Glycine zipper domain-containing protein n=1 Tax=Adineta steineri TaxID=433720 RepID=A0A820ARE7_9BILA|nr:unnamed protein product [Adineta steineri]